jgi:type IV secretory pathway TrbF-like protein
MIFRRSSQRYGRTPAPVTPYQRAAQEWDERIGSARVQARNWRLMAFGQLLLAGGLASALVWSGSRSGIVPYVVEVDRLGETRAVGPAIERYQPKDAEIAWHLARFIGNVRSLSFDPVLVRRSWLEAYDYVSGKAARFLDEFARASDPFSEIGVRTIAVDVTSVVRATADSFQVKWEERAYERGNLVSTTHWTAILGITIDPPRDADTLRRNPLGLYVRDLAWSRDLAPETPSSPEK